MPSPAAPQRGSIGKGADVLLLSRLDLVDMFSEDDRGHAVGVDQTGSENIAIPQVSDHVITAADHQRTQTMSTAISPRAIYFSGQV